MKKDTRERINLYEERLPKVKEKALGAAAMLVVAGVMAVSATFAWVTLSAAPEAGKISTTVSANGNLEIALADLDGAEPDVSAVGDSTAAGKKLTEANLTWGNLVNLSDDSYGLSNLTLRPARLNTEALRKKPLRGVKYGTDGRITDYDSSYAFSIWDTKEGRFVVKEGDVFGVRGISSVTYEASSEEWQFVNTLVENYDSAITKAQQKYSELVNSSESQGLVQALLEKYIDIKVNTVPMANKDCSDVLEQMYNLLVDYEKCMNAEGEAYLRLIDLQMYQKWGMAEYGNHTIKSVDELRQNSAAQLTGKNIVLDGVTRKEKYWGTAPERTTNYGYNQYRTDYNNIDTDVARLKKLIDDGGVATWADLNAIINRVVDINTATLVVGDKTKAVASIGISDGLTLNSERNIVHPAKLNNGYLKNFEQRVGGSGRFNYSTTVSATAMGITVPVKTMVTTSAEAVTTEHSESKVYGMGNDLAYTNKLIESGLEGGSLAAAEDTYGMAIDMWVRTNAPDAALILEGKADIETEIVKVTGTVNGKTVELYTTTVRGAGKTEQASVPLYHKPGDDLTWYEYGTRDFAGTENNSPYTLPDGKIPAPTMKTDDETGAEVQEQLEITVGGEKIMVDAYYIIVDKTVYEEREVSLYKTDSGEFRGYDEASGNTYDITLTEAEKAAVKEKTKQVERVTGFEGENRVWNESDSDALLLKDNNTTQGVGSSYVFYSYTPTDQANTLKLLGSMKVAFVDEFGDLLAIAGMDTDHAYAEIGKVTVPLVIESGINAGEDEDGNAIYGITKLRQNEASMITSILYIDGEKITNDQVLAVNDIQGQLNIQFGTNCDLDAATNEPLAIKERTVSATISKNSFTASDNNRNAMVTVTVEGDEPNIVEANFMRQISKTQGTRMDTLSFTNENGSWTAEANFGAPGKYVLRSVKLNGIDIDLKEPIEVTVDGFGLSRLDVKSISADATAFGDTHIFTAKSSADSVEGEINLTLTGEWAGNVKSLKAQLVDVNDASNTVTVDMKEEGNGGAWSGIAAFTQSRKYKLAYLIADGEYFDIDELGARQGTNFAWTADIHLGLRAAVSIERRNQEFLFEGEARSIPVKVQILDNSGNLMPYENNVKLVYQKRGSAQEISAEGLVWNAFSEYYEGGNFPITQAGVYSFSYLEADGSRINVASSAPMIRAMSLNPPEFTNSYNTSAYQFAPDADAVMYAQLAYATAVEVEAYAVNTRGAQAGTGEWVAGIPVDTNDPNLPSDSAVFSFMPKNGSTQDGDWEIRELRFTGVTTEDGHTYDGEENGGYYPVKLSKDEYVKSSIRTSVNVELTNPDETAFSGKFMDAHTIGGLKVIVSDAYREELRTDAAKVGGVNVTYTHKAGTASEYGHYTLADGSEADGESVVANLPMSDNKTAVQNGSPEFRTAGEYDGVLTFSISANEKNYNYSTNSSDDPEIKNPVNYVDVKQIKISSEKPMLKITSVSPAPSTTFQINPNGLSDPKWLNSHNFLSPDGLYARLSCNAKSTSSTSWSKATVRLIDAGTNYTSASFTVKAQFEGETDYSATYSYTPNTIEITKEIGGGGELGIFGIKHYARAGYQKFDDIEMSYDGDTYKVELSDRLEIYGYDTKIPSFQYSAGDYSSNGVVVPSETVEFPYYDQNKNVITLGSVDDAHKTLNDTYEEAGDLDSTRTQTTESTETLYYEGSEGSGCNKKTVYFPYTVKTVIEKTPAVKNTYNATYNFAGWKIMQKTQQTGAETQYGGGRTYTVGTKLTFATSAQQDYTATPVYNVGDKEFVSSTEQNYIVTKVTVTAGTKTETKPSGTKKDSAADITSLAGTTESWE
ncbi:MAG: hypothetical protein HFE30_01295 [Clostridiales bacterium]|nr:hypothetical protein [Clostridiales bacterium]